MPQSRKLHPGPQRRARRLWARRRWAGSAPSEPQGQRGLPAPQYPPSPALGRGERVGRKASGARPWAAPSPRGLGPRWGAGGAKSAQAAAASALGEPGMRRGEGARRVAEAEERGRAPGPRPGSRRAGAGRARVAERLTSASRGRPAGGAGCASDFRAHAASGSTVPVPGAHHQASAPSSSGARTASGALSPAGSA